MKQLITIFIIVLATSAYSQLKACYSLEEAQKDPKQVEELHLTNSPFVLIDTNFNQFTALKVLNLAYSPVMEVAPNVLIPSLKELNLSHASYNPWKISSIGQAFPNLEKLNLSGNQLPFIWSGLQSLGNLLALDISDNQLVTIPVEIMYLSNLKELNLANNHIKLQANELGALWALKKLNISSNSNLGSNNLILSIAESKQLKDLTIDGNGLNPTSIQLLSKMDLERLELANVNEPSTIDFTRFSSTKNLALTHSPNWLSKENEKQFDNISKLELTNSLIPIGLEKLKSLNTLVLKDITEDQLPKLYALKRLRILDISETSFNKDQIEKLKQELPRTQIITGNPDVTENMIANKVDPILELPAKKIAIQSTISSTISEKNVTLEIPENAFLDSNGKPYTGQVNIELTVYNDAIQTALAGIPMTFNENGQQELFASNGMLKLEAKGENEEILQPNPTNLIQASVGNLQPQNSGGLYSFNSQTGQWSTISDTVNKSNLNELIQRAIDSINGLELKNIVPRTINDRIFSIYPKFSRFDRTEFSLHSQLAPSISNSLVVTNNRKHALGKLMLKQKWVIDTIVSKEMKKHLKVMKKETKGWKAKRLNKRIPINFIPRLINRLDIKVDPSHDNYRLTFMYRDSAVSFPVAVAGGSNKQIQRNTQKFHDALKQVNKKDQRDEFNYEKLLEEQLKINDKAIRQNLINLAIMRLTQPSTMINQNQIGAAPIWNSPNQLNFGLSTFGLVNCDFFMRTPPEYVLSANSTLKDQNGEEYPLPNSIISVDPLLNYYMETASNFPVNCFRTSYLVFNLGAKKIGVSKPKEGVHLVSEITVIDISDKTPDEISKAILSI
ncbi:leucine-rich repeat domain-containing protein [Fluviicola taffensis]|uniref:Leucine-rich repeat-containing protein n=1 Tax=Fluviicola taffensis (strain DSM 16823 / NCIMB 13979 / RW262) TaxID=755732 RepID=F2IGW4_FLUTR|nr:leucine-rich repeat domain-containing protein [Fluviicola taffensis]AEA44745.1 leucine-rich repeat-containing protein [Fluviicola taffensis DSM 16823]